MKNTQQKLLEMLHLQDEINSKISPTWRDDNRQWYRAIWIELAELMEDHIGYKWWKFETVNLEQAQLELVDIFHFGLSHLLNNDSKENIVKKYSSVLEYSISEENDLEKTREKIEELVESSIAHKHFNLELFTQLCANLQLDFDEMYRQYVGKNVLNFFRQNHGYKDGSYIKIWNGEEDNIVMRRILDSLDSNAADFSDKLASALEESYAELSQ